MPNRFNLLEFEYTFDIPMPETGQSATVVDKFPRQVLDLMRKTSGDVRRIEASLAQGRW